MRVKHRKLGIEGTTLSTFYGRPDELNAYDQHHEEQYGWLISACDVLINGQWKDMELALKDGDIYRDKTALLEKK